MLDLVDRLSDELRQKKLMLSTAESCTGGLVSAAITSRAGSSDIFDCGFVTYSNEAKTSILGVPHQLIVMQGAVTSGCAEAMARGAVKNSRAQLGLSITGIAGPGGGSEKKPVGTVFLGYHMEGGLTGHIECHFDGDREKVRSQSAIECLKLGIEILERVKG